MILLLQSAQGWPWWISLIAGAVGGAAGLTLGLIKELPWRSVAAARKETLEDLRAECLEKDKTIVRLEAELKVSQAKTDLNGLRGEFAKEMKEIKEEFKSHADQDLITANQHIETARQQIEVTKQHTAALAAVEATLRLLQERH